jgi:hypothetical protein
MDFLDRLFLNCNCMNVDRLEIILDGQCVEFLLQTSKMTPAISIVAKQVREMSFERMEYRDLSASVIEYSIQSLEKKISLK